MQAIIYRISFYNTEVLTKGWKWDGAFFLFTTNIKRNTCETRYSLQTFPHPFHPPNSSSTLTATCQAGYSDVLQPNTVNGWDLCSKMQLQNINYSIMLTVQTIKFNNKTPCTLHSAFMCSA
jgi:hypothetical protein